MICCTANKSYACKTHCPGHDLLICHACLVQTFGLPSVRTDVPAPTNRSVANTHNYGNEPDAMVLLRPPKSVDLGVEEAHLLALRNRDQLLQLLQESGLDLTEGEFEQAFAMAADVDGQAADRQRCSLNTFMRARHYLLAQAT